MAFVIVCMGTVLTLLSGDKDWYWLAVSDLNVALALFIAWYFQRYRKI